MAYQPSVLEILLYALTVEQGVPARGVSVPTGGNRSMWRVNYRPEATAAQRLQGDSLLQTIDLTDAARLTAMREAEATTQFADQRMLKAVVRDGCANCGMATLGHWRWCERCWRMLALGAWVSIGSVIVGTVVAVWAAWMRLS